MFEKLSDVFIAAAEKYLTAVDAEPVKSNQHEIGGLKKAGLANYLGYPLNGEKVYFPVTLVYIDDTYDEPIICKDTFSWYDVRFNQQHRSPEFRLYYPSNAITEKFGAGDYFLLALTREHTLLAVFAPSGSTAEQQVRSLFGSIGLQTSESLSSVAIEESQLVAPVRLMLAELGIEIYSKEANDQKLLNKILQKFKGQFPKTSIFSEYARKQLSSTTCAQSDPDTLLLEWMDYEERLFRILERYIVSETLKKGFGESGHDVDEFIKFSLSVQNRRKSRVGHAFENHITEILLLNNVNFEKGVCTEGKQKPDFLLPSYAAYQNPDFSSDRLFMLAAKTTCKDRWRQILVEAERVKVKHLITMEPAISSDQTIQMSQLGVKLIVPLPIQKTYSDTQTNTIISFKGFIEKTR